MSCVFVLFSWLVLFYLCARPLIYSPPHYKNPCNLINVYLSCGMDKGSGVMHFPFGFCGCKKCAWK